MADHIEPYAGAVSPEAEERWKRAKDAHLRKHGTNQRITLGIVLAVLAIAFVLLVR